MPESLAALLQRPPISWRDLLDIAVVSFLIDESLKLIRGTRAVQMAVGSLLLGLYDDGGNLVFIGHTSSFNRADRRKLKEIVEPLRSDNPFSVRVPGGPSRWSNERTGEWEALKPTLVCEVQYDYFSQGRFRHGSKFMRWRPDKKPRSCTMEQVDPGTKKGSLKKLKMG